MQLSQGFIIDSYHFYNIAKESYYKAQQGFDIHRQNDALVAIIFAALSLEAFINELGDLARDMKARGHEEDFLDRLIDAIFESQGSKKNTQDKFMDASAALSNTFDKGKYPYQDFVELLRLRNCLAHLKPQDRLEIDEDSNWFYSGRNLINKLRSKGILQNHTKIESITLLVSTAKAAKWACNTASAMVNAILDSIPDSGFSNDNQEIALYKSMFQPLEAEEQHHRQIAVAQADELHTRLLKTYGEFPDSVELRYEDS